MTDKDGRPHSVTITAAEDLTAAMDRLGIDIHGLDRAGKRNRRLIFAVAASVVLDVALTVVLGFTAIKANDAAVSAASATASNVVNEQATRIACVATNEARAASVQLWKAVVDAMAKADPSPGNDKVIAELRAYITVGFAPRDCGTP
jgi:hypothetical protein